MGRSIGCLLLAFLGFAASAWGEEPARVEVSLALEARATGAGLAGALRLEVKGLEEEVRGVVSVYLLAGADDAYGGLRLCAVAEEIQLEGDGVRRYVLGKDLAPDLSELPAGSYTVVAEVLLRGLDTWEQARATADVDHDPRTAPKALLRFARTRAPKDDVSRGSDGRVELPLAYDVESTASESRWVEIAERVWIEGREDSASRTWSFRVKARSDDARSVQSPWRVALPPGEHVLRYEVRADGLEPLSGAAPFSVSGK